jgi:alkylation response protein AidB-like acyl-CoA dehydrogenase
MNYLSPVAEQRFVLEHVAGIGTLARTERFAAAEPDMIDAILEGAGAFAAGEWAPLNRVGDTQPPQWRDGAVTMPPGFRAAYRAFVEGGWNTIATPVDFGGQGLPAVLGLAVAESLGTANMAFNLCPMLSSGAVEALVSHGSPELQAAYLPRLISGEWTGTMNLTEPQAGSDVGALRTVATPAADGSWRIKGNKIFITFGEHDLAENIIHLVLARTPGAPAGTKGISLFLVPKVKPDGATNDLHCVSIEHKLGIHASPTCAMSFGDNDACAGWLVGEEFGGMPAMFTMMNMARLNVGLQGVEIAERATQQALAYARERVQSARASAPGAGPVPIIQHPDVRRMLMTMSVQTQAIRALVYAAVAEADRASLGLAGAKERLDLLTPLAKAHGTDIGCEVASLGVQVHGGMGFIEEAGAAQHYRDARIAPIYEGTNGIQAADLVGRKLARDGGVAMRSLVAEIRAEAQSDGLLTLVRDVDVATATLLEMDVDDRLAASAPYLTLVSVMVCGWLMEQQGRIARGLLEAGQGEDQFLDWKVASADYYLAQIAPRAAGLATIVANGQAGLGALNLIG